MFGFGTTVGFGGQHKVSETNLLSGFGPGKELTEKQSNKFSKLLDKLLSSPSANLSNISLLAGNFAAQYPQVDAFQPGGEIFNTILKRSIGGEGKRGTLADANFMAQQVFGRPLDKEERQYVKENQPSPQEFAGLLYSSPEAYYAATPSGPEEARMAAYYGPQIATRSPSGGVMYTGMRNLRSPFDLM